MYIKFNEIEAKRIIFIHLWCSAVIQMIWSHSFLRFVVFISMYKISTTTTTKSTEWRHFKWTQWFVDWTKRAMMPMSQWFVNEMMNVRCLLKLFQHTKNNRENFYKHHFRSVTFVFIWLIIDFHIVWKERKTLTQTSQFELINGYMCLL